MLKGCHLINFWWTFEKFQTIISGFIYIYIYIYVHIYIYIKQYIKYFPDATLTFFFRKLLTFYVLDLAKTVRALGIVSEKSTRNFGIKKLGALENHVLVNMLHSSSHFASYIGYTLVQSSN